MRSIELPVWPLLVAALAMPTACGGTVVFEEPGNGGGSGDGDGDGDGAGGPTSTSVSTTTDFASTGTGSDTCPPDTVYTCDGGVTCISQGEICNDIFDCADGTDEIECGSACTDAEFTCDDGLCIPLGWLCDGESDCDFGEDESGELCGAVDCGFDELPCRDGSCIPDDFVCDGEADCNDGADETSDVCNGFVCGFPEIATEDPPFAYCLTYFCCSAFEICVANGVDACLECLNMGGVECDPVFECIVDNCSG
jgi:hypothetical protein